MDKEKMAEAIDVNISVAKGYCDRCKIASVKSQKINHIEG